MKKRIISGLLREIHVVENDKISKKDVKFYNPLFSFEEFAILQLWKQATRVREVKTGQVSSKTGSNAYGAQIHLLGYLIRCGSPVRLESNIILIFISPDILP